MTSRVSVRRLPVSSGLALRSTRPRGPTTPQREKAPIAWRFARQYPRGDRWIDRPRKHGVTRRQNGKGSVPPRMRFERGHQRPILPHGFWLARKPKCPSDLRSIIRRIERGGRRHNLAHDTQREHVSSDHVVCPHVPQHQATRRDDSQRQTPIRRQSRDRQHITGWEDAPAAMTSDQTLRYAVTM